MKYGRKNKSCSRQPVIRTPRVLSKSAITQPTARRRTRDHPNGEENNRLKNNEAQN